MLAYLRSLRFLREIIDFVENDERFELHVGGFGIMEDEIASAARSVIELFFMENCLIIRLYRWKIHVIL